MSFSSKQWIAHLTALFTQIATDQPVEITEAAPDHDATKSFLDQFHDAAMKLIGECLDIASLRLRSDVRELNALTFFDTERTVAAFREAGVKWTAVVHGFQQAHQGHRLYPIFRGGLLIPLLKSLETRLEAGDIAPHAARAMLRQFGEVSKKLNWNEDGALNVFFAGPEAILYKAQAKHEEAQALKNLPEIEGFIRSVADYDMMKRKLALGHKLHPKQQTKMDALKRWIDLNSNEYFAMIEKLPRENREQLLAKVQKLLEEINKPMEQLASELAASAQPKKRQGKNKRRKQHTKAGKGSGKPSAPPTEAIAA